MDYHFDTPSTPNLRVEITAGELEIHTHDAPAVDVRLEPMGTDLERAEKLMQQIRVEQSGDTVSVLYPKERGKLFGSRAAVRTIVHTPVRTRAALRADSADITSTGQLGDVVVKSGSGDVEFERVGELDLRTGSGDVRVQEINGSTDTKTGSGDIDLGHVHGSAQVGTGSGDVRLGAVDGKASVKAASGDVAVGEAGAELDAMTASGDLSIDRVRGGRVQTRAASGDIKIGVVDGVPVLLDVSTVSGDVRSQLEASDAPSDGGGAQVTAHTTSGDISLVKVGA